MTTNDDDTQALTTDAIRERLIAEGYSGEELQRKAAEGLAGAAVIGIAQGLVGMLNTQSPEIDAEDQRLAGGTESHPQA